MYQSPLVVLPADGDTVWIRAYNQYSQAVQAVYRDATKDFKVIAVGVIVPAYFVSRWKPL